MFRKALKFSFSVAIVLWLAVGPAVAGNKDPAFIKLGAGDAGSVFADRDQAGVFSIEYRAGPELEFFIFDHLWVLSARPTPVFMDGLVFPEIFFSGDASC